ncbi:MAG TPA: carboxypeptidase-like regulatory domain-containing protein [Terracidiphilus sp.]|nr:carboxypeptidase-like regulatory domain-containing protein [Terracidiphilus sp.]
MPPQLSSQTAGANGASFSAAGSKSAVDPAAGQKAATGPAVVAANPEMGSLSATVTDTNGDLVSGASVSIHAENGTDGQNTVADDNGGFEFKNLKPGTPYIIAIKAEGFVDWSSSPIVLQPGQYDFLPAIKLTLTAAGTSVTVSAATEHEIAVQQVQAEEKQRVLGIIPNFYVVYDSKNAVPLTPRLKFQMAFRVSIDPVAFAGSAFLGAVNQAADTPNYPQGWGGYGKRVGAVYTDGLTDIMFGGAILPTLLRQDPRYFYQGTGTIRSRTFHALEAPFVCKGDDGKWQPNYSSVGGDLASSAISNLYYPKSNRGVGLVFANTGINTGERMVSTLIQEFVLRRLTPSARQ